MLVENVQRSIALVAAAPADVFVWSDVKCIELLMSNPDSDVCWGPLMRARS